MTFSETTRPMTLADFDFALPESLIAQHPLPERSASRLLHVEARGALADRRFADLPTLLRAGDLLVLNNTRVIRARFFGHKASGGAVEVLLERIVDGQVAHAMVRASKSPKPGSRLRLAGAFECTVAGRAGQNGEFFVLRLDAGGDWWRRAEQFGHLPLPPYIGHRPDAEDEERYQTVFSQQPGAVAAPTAGLHFDPPLFERLQKIGVVATYVTLHVGAGTFQPVRVEKIAEHRMHRERYEIPAATAAAIRAARAEGRRVVAVGTTSLRALETAAAASADGLPVAGAAESDIFITPGFRFRVADALITNFHLPKSTLLMLVSAFAGVAEIRRAYAHAIAGGYRFFSYGDAMLLEGKSDEI